MNGVGVPPSSSHGTTTMCIQEPGDLSAIEKLRERNSLGLANVDDPRVDCSDPSTSEDFVNGIMKIVPSDIDVSKYDIKQSYLWLKYV